MAESGLTARFRRSAGALAVDSFFRTASAVGKLHPRAKPAHHGVEVLRERAPTVLEALTCITIAAACRGRTGD